MNDTEKIKKQFKIPEDFEKQRLDQALAKLLPEFSRSQIQHWIEAGEVLVNGKQQKPKTKMKGGELIEINAQIKVHMPWQAEPIELNILYEDEDLLIINKPVGMVVHPAAGNPSKTLLNALLHHNASLNELPRAGILHRLDKDTSGLLLVAKTHQSLKHLSTQLKKRSLLREYQTIVYGNLLSGGTIDAPLDRHPKERKKMAIVEEGKKAITHYRVIEKYRAHTRLSVKLETGRTHQIRVHMASIYHPIVGDKTYGRLQLAKHMSNECIHFLRQFKRQALHAVAIGFIHPKTQEWMRFESELPEDILKLISVLRDDLKRNTT